MNSHVPHSALLPRTHVFDIGKKSVLKGSSHHLCHSTRLENKSIEIMPLPARYWRRQRFSLCRREGGDKREDGGCGLCFDWLLITRIWEKGFIMGQWAYELSHHHPPLLKVNSTCWLARLMFSSSSLTVSAWNLFFWIPFLLPLRPPSAIAHYHIGRRTERLFTLSTRQWKSFKQELRDSAGEVESCAEFWLA